MDEGSIQMRQFLMKYISPDNFSSEKFLKIPTVEETLTGSMVGDPSPSKGGDIFFENAR